jgi:serine O-acetyltransferase
MPRRETFTGSRKIIYSISDYLVVLCTIAGSLFGGFWGIRERIIRTGPGLRQKILIWIYSLYLREECCDIGYDTRFEGRATFPHGLFGIFISGSTKIGKNCTIFQNVTIGSNTLPGSKKTGAPNIGDNVFIGAGATIIGGISIGDNCRIGANCTIARDIPPDCLVVSETPRIIQREHLENNYYSYSAEGWVRFNEGIPVIETDPDVVEPLNVKFNKIR